MTLLKSFLVILLDRFKLTYVYLNEGDMFESYSCFELASFNCCFNSQYFFYKKYFYFNDSIDI